LQVLFFTAFGLANTERVDEAAIVDAEVVIADERIFGWASAKIAALGGAAATEILSTEGGVHPGIGSPVESVAENETFDGAVAEVGNKKTGLANFGGRRSSGVREPDEGDAEEAEVSADQSDFIVEVHVGMRGKKLPAGTRGIADGDPGFADDVDIFAKALGFFGLEKKGIFGDEDGGAGLTDDFYGAADAMEEAVAGVDVVVGVVGFEMLIFEIVTDMAGGGDVGGGVVVFDMVGGEFGAGIADDHVAIGNVEVALAALRTAGGEFGEFAFSAGKMDLLRMSGRRG